MRRLNRCNRQLYPLRPPTPNYFSSLSESSQPLWALDPLSYISIGLLLLSSRHVRLPSSSLPFFFICEHKIGREITWRLKCRWTIIEKNCVDFVKNVRLLLTYQIQFFLTFSLDFVVLPTLLVSLPTLLGVL